MPKTLKTFRSRIEKMFFTANPDAKDAKLTWTHCASVTWHDGTKGYSGTLKVEAEGYKTRTMIATAMDTGLSLR